MSVTSDFWKAMNQSGATVSNSSPSGSNKKSGGTAVSGGSQSTSSGKKKKSISEEFWEAMDDDDIAPVASRGSSVAARVYARANGGKKDDEEEEEKGWFQKGLFEDGWDFGDIAKTILGTGADVLEDLGAGIAEMPEKIADAAAMIAPYFAQSQINQAAYSTMNTDLLKASKEYDLKEEKKKAGEWVAKDLYDGAEVAHSILNPVTDGVSTMIGQDYETASVLGEKADYLAQSGGQLLATAGLQMVGVPWFLTTGATTFGAEAENALNQGASHEQAMGSAAISAAAEILTEKISGGIKFGGKAADDWITDRIARGITNKLGRALTRVGVDAAGESFEELLSEAAGKVGSSLYREESLWELLSNEEALDDYLDAMIGGGLLGGVSGGTKAVNSARKGVDYVSGLTKNEQKVVDKVYKDRLAEEQKKGKVTEKQKDAIYEKVLSDMDKGYITSDTIEEVLGGDAYNSYLNLKAEADEYKTLYETESGKLSERQKDRLAELKEKNKAKSYEDALKEAQGSLSENVFSLVKGDRLVESYNERSRRGQAFEADLTQYDAKQQEVIKRAVDSGILNNTNRTHEFVDMVAKISADKGVLFDFTNNQKLKESGFAVDGKQVNGYITKDGITLNIDSAKAMEATVGHEITHVLEGTEFYDSLKQTLFEYAKTKGEYQTRYDSLAEMYKDIKDADIDNELAADLVGDYLFNDTDFIKNLSTQNRNVFQKIYDEIKYLCKVVTAGSKEARELERVKKAFEDAYRAEGKVQEGTKYSISETGDGRFVAVVDNDILSNIDTSSWDKTTKDAARKAASEALKQFSDGIVVDGITRKVNRTSRMEYTRSKYTEKLFNRSPDVFADKMRAADVADDVVVVATNWQRDGGLKHPRTDDFVDFDHGKTLIVSGDAKYSAEVIVGITANGEGVLYDVVDMEPATFDVKKEESPTIATTQNAIGNAHGNSFDDNVAQDGDAVKYSLNELTDDGLTMTYVRVPNQNTQYYGSTYGQNIEPAGEYMSMDTMEGKNKIDGYEYGTIQFKKPLVLEHINTSDTGWKKTVSDMYGGLTGKKLTKALIKDGYDAIVTYDDYGYNEIVNLNGTKLSDQSAKYSLSDNRTYAEITEEQMKLNQRERDLAVRKQEAVNNPELLQAMDDYSNLFTEMRKLLPKKKQGTATQAELDRIEEIKDLRDVYMQRVSDLQESLGLNAIAQEETEIRETKEALRVASDAAWAREGAEKENKAIAKSGLSAPEYFRKKALKAFKTTTNFNEAGYMLPDGKLLNFSGGERNHRYRDHREIGEIYEATNGVAALNRFMSDGNIRIMAESPGIDLASGVEPTKEQYAALRKFINTNGVKDGKFFVDFSDAEGHRAGNYSYQGRVIADRVINDIKYFYQNGTIRESSRLTDFLSLSNAGEAPVRPSYRATMGEDIALQDIAPTAEDSSVVAENATTGEAPIYESNDKTAPEGQTAMFEPVEEAPKRSTRKELHQNIIDSIIDRFDEKGFDFDTVLKKAKDLSTWSTVDNTPQRVMEKALGYKAGGILADITVNKVAQNESEGIKWINEKVKVLKEISKQYHIKPGSKESAAAQMYAEGFYVNENNEIIRYGEPELIQDFKNPEVRRNIKALAGDPRIRKIYDDTLASINESRTRNAYPEIPRLDNYFLHFRAMNDTFSTLGLPFNPNDIRAKDLPTDLNGVTADLKPGQPYFASAMHRKGKRTSFDMLGGIERYLNSAKNQIYHIDDIQTLRALRNYIAETYGQATGLEDIDNMSDAEAEERIKQVYGSHLSTFAKFLNEEANVLAGKTALIDRGVEGIIGRRGITFLNTLNQQVGSNMVGYNVSSSLTNFLPVAQTFAKTNKFDFTKAFAQTVANKVSGGRFDSFAKDSPVVIRRKGSDRFYQTPWQKMANPGYVLMSAVDDISTELIARTKYNEFTRKGMDSQKAHFETDKWVSKLMGDRSLGQQPQLYNSKMLGLVTKFQLEVRNQLDAQFYDTIQETKASNEHIQNGLARNAMTAAKVASTFTQLAVVQHLFGKAFESVAGYNPAFDIIEVLMTAFGYDDDEESEDTALDNLTQGLLALAEDLPYVSTFTGGRIPISEAIPDVNAVLRGEDEYGNEIGVRKALWEEAKDIAPYYALPGGHGQIKKTVAGLKMFSDEHPIAGSYTDAGNLRFPVEDTFGSKAKAAVFGQYASENARKYFDEEQRTLNPEQTEIFAGLDMPIEDYWEYRDNLYEFYDVKDKLLSAAYADGATDEDVLKGLYVDAVYDELWDLYKQQQEIASGDGLFKQDKLREIQTQMSNMLANSKHEMDNVHIDGYYATIGDQRFDYSDYSGRWYRIEGEYLEREQNAIKRYGITPSDYWNDTDLYYHADWYFDDKYATVDREVVANLVYGGKRFAPYAADLGQIKGEDKNGDGRTDSGSKKANIIDYINSRNDLDYAEKVIMLKMSYPSEDEYNDDIVDYLNSRDDISAEEMRTILEELGATVDSKGYITW